MADGTTVDSLQVEIVATSTEAEKRVNDLSAALERLKNATTGFGSVGDRIRDIGASASGATATSKTRQRREVLDRATESVSPSKSAGFSADKISRDLSRIDKEIEKTTKKILSLQEAFESTFNSSKKANLSQQLDQYGKLQDALDAQRRTILKSLENASEHSPVEMGLEKKVEALKNAKEHIRTALSDKPFSTMRDESKSSGLVYGLESLRIGFAALGNIAPAAAAKVRDAIKSIDIKSFWDLERGTSNESSNLAYGLDSLRLGFVGLINPLKNLAGLLDIKTPEGLKDLLSRDLSLQNLIPKGFEKAIDALKNSFGGMTNKVLEFASAHPAAAAAMIGLKSAAQTVFRAMKDFASLSFSALKTGLQTAASAAKKLGSALAGLAGAGIRKLASGLKSVGKYLISDFTKPFQAATKAVIRWKNAIGRIVFMRAVRGVIRTITEGFKTGTDNLYQYSKMVGTEFAPAMDKLATSALYLKNSLGAMAAPIIEAVAPAIDILVDKFVDLMNAAGKTFAALTGKSVYTQARKHAVEYAEAAEDAEEKTKEFKKFLLGIDELNIMPSQDEDKEEKKNPLEDYKSMFEEVSIPVEQMDWAKQIREAIENGDWYSVGRIVAEKLNELVDGWDSFAWGENLGQKITNALKVAFGFLENFDFENLGKKVAEAINGLFEGIDWDLLGRTFAEKWNSLFEFIYGLATNLKWAEIGLNIAQMINGFLDQLDAKKAAEAVSKFITGLFEMINTAITETNWALLGEKLAEFINNVDWYGIIYGGLSIITNGLAALKKGIDSFLENWEWEDMAEQIYTAINDAWNDIDWNGLGKTIGDLLGVSLKFAAEILSNINWAQILQGVADAIVGFFEGIGQQLNLESVTGPLINIVETISNTLQTMIEQTKEWLDSLDLEPLKSAFNGLFSAISPLVEVISSGLLWAWENVLLPLAGWFIEDAAPAGIKLLTSVLQGLGEILTALSPIFETLWKGILQPLVSFLGGAFVAAVNAVASAIEGITSIVQGFIDLISKAVNSVQSFFGASGSISSKSNGFTSTFKARSISETNYILGDIQAPKAYASGGFPGKGEMFIAREAGPELVGKIGQKNTVANNEQITSGIADGVRDANTDVVNAVYAMASMIVKSIEDKNTDITLDGQSLARGIQTYEKRLSSIQGRSLIN